MMSPATPWPPGYSMSLGTPERVYRQGGSSRLMMILRVALWLALGVGVGYLGYLFLGEPGSSAGFNGIGLAAVGAYIFLFALVSAPLLKRLTAYRKDSGAVALLCPDGVAYCHSGRWRDLRWDEVEAVVNSKETSGFGSGGNGLGMVFDLLSMVLRGHVRHYSILTSSGDWLHLGETLSGADELMATICERTFPHRQAAAWEKFEAGKTVDFGALTVGKSEGISAASKGYRWENIGSVKIFGDTEKFLIIKPPVTERLTLNDLKIMAGGDEIKISEAKVWNTDVLLFIVAEMLGVTTVHGEKSVKRKKEQ